MCHERGQRWRNGVSCPLLDNKSPQNVMAWNNEQLLSPFPWPQWVGLAESRVRLQTRGWLVPHHRQARLGTRICFQTHSQAAAGRGSAGCRPNWTLLGCPHSICQPLPSGPPGRGKWETSVPITTWPQKGHFTPSAVFCPLGVSPVHSEREEFRLHFGRKNIKGFMDLF